MPTPAVYCGAGLASCFCGWECIKPLIMRGVTKVIVKVAPKYLGGAELELDKLNVTLSSSLHVKLEGLKVHNLKDKGFVTPLMLSGDRIVVEVNPKNIIKSACESRGKSIEVQVGIVHVNGLNLTVEKHMITDSNVQEFLKALKKKQEAAALENGDAHNGAVSAVHGLMSGSKEKKKAKKVKLQLRMVDLHNIEVAMTSSWQLEQGVTPLHVKMKDLHVDMTPKDGSDGMDVAAAISRLFTTVFQDIFYEAGKSGVEGAQDFASAICNSLPSTMEDAGGYAGGGFSWLGSFFFSPPKRKTTMRFKPGKLGLQITRSTGVVNTIHEGSQAADTVISAGWQIEMLGDYPYSEERLDMLIAGRDPFIITFSHD